MAARWIPADEWLRSLEDQEPRRSLGYLLPGGRPCPPPPPPAPTLPDGPWVDLLPRIDLVVDAIRLQPKRKLAGRRTALLEDAGLAREVYELVRERGIQDALDHLGVAYQALIDVWLKHEWPPPLRPRRRIGGGS